MHLKLKYHNLQGESVTINIDLEGEKIIYQALQKDQGEDAAKEVSVASMTGQLDMMGNCPLLSRYANKWNMKNKRQLPHLVVFLFPFTPNNVII